MKTIVITGVSKGIGLEVAKIFLANNFQVVGISRHTPENLSDHKQFSFLKADLSKPENIKEACQKASREKKIHALVNNAGFGHFAALENIPEEKIISMINLNLTAQILMTKYLLKNIRENQGHIFNISSRAGHSAYRFGTVYCASKFGLRGFSEGLFDEVRNAGVRVSNISPGPVDTPFWDDLDRKPEDRPQTSVSPEDIAKVIFDTYQNKTGVLSEIIILPQVHAMKFKKIKS